MCRYMKPHGGQSKKHSVLEAAINIASGMVIAFLVTQFFAVPILGITISLAQNSVLTIILTIISITRSYVWRRIFNKWHIKCLGG